MINRDLERENLRRRALKCGIRSELIFPGADLQRDIMLRQGANGLDFDLVCGIDNLAQALATALTTRLGDDIFNVNFGFDGLNAIAEETNPILQKERIRVAVIQVLQREPRIRRILDVQLTGDERLGIPPPSVDASAFPTPDAAQAERMRQSRQLDIYVWCEAVSGDETAVSVQRIAVNG